MLFSSELSEWRTDINSYAPMIKIQSKNPHQATLVFLSNDKVIIYYTNDAEKSIQVSKSIPSIYQSVKSIFEHKYN